MKRWVHASYSSAVNHCIIAVQSSVLGLTNDVFWLKSIPKLFFHRLFPILYWITFGQQDLSLFPAEITQQVVQITSISNVLEFE